MAARCVHGLSALLCLLLAWPLQAQQLLIQRSPLAGFNHHAAPRLWPQLREGDALELVLQQDNPHDAQAVQVRWRAHWPAACPCRLASGACTNTLTRAGASRSRYGRARRLDPAQTWRAPRSTSPALAGAGAAGLG